MRKGAGTLVLAVIVLGSASACRGALSAYADSPPAAEQAADDFAAGILLRFSTPERDPSFGYARMRIARYALAPSKLVDDSVWSKVTPARYAVVAHGRYTGGRYVFTARPEVPLPSRLGDSRHAVELDTLPDGDWRWRTQVDHAVGRMTPHAMADILTALMRSAERPAEQIRADYRATLPRTTAALGRLATLDTVRTERQADGSTLVTLGIQLAPDRISAAFPNFARFLKKYVSPARYSYVLRDPSLPGMHARDRWFVAEADRDLLMLRFRSRNGVLQPLDGPARAMPRSLALEARASAKVSMFTVGVTELFGRFTFVNTPTEVGWDIHFETEPEWDLPPVAGLLIRSPLQRPFQGDGSSLRLTMKRLPSGQTAIHRRTEVAVHESAVLRWLGNLGFTAMDDFAGKVELEEAQFTADAMRAMRADIAALGERN